MSEEVWRPYPPDSNIEASTHGRVRRRLRSGKWKIVSCEPKAGGYRFVGLGSGKWVAIHLIVLHAFVGPPPDGLEGCHGDGDKANNRPDNLRYDTHAANVKDRYRHGTIRLGEDSAVATLTNAQAMRALELSRAGMTPSTIAASLGASYFVIYKLVKRKTWKHLDAPAGVKLHGCNAESIRPASPVTEG